MSKKDLRKQIYSVLKSLAPREIEIQSQEVVRKVVSHPEFIKSQRISVYLSTSTEINTVPLLRAIFEQSKQCFVPCFIAQSAVMQMVRLHSMADYDALPTTMWNIKQPLVNDDRENAMQTGGVDLVLVPGVAFTRTGCRLGHGRGYYDRFLTAHQETLGKRAYTIALALKEQILDEIPVTDNDVTIDNVMFDDR